MNNEPMNILNAEAVQYSKEIKKKYLNKSSFL